MTNSLFWRSFVILADACCPGPANNTENFYNNLLMYGTIETFHQGSGIWSFYDNLFDYATNYICGKYDGIDASGHNAYVETNAPLTTNGNITLGGPSFQNGTLGSYYYPTTLTSLIHAGSRSAAAAGLYHYTVTANNVPDGTNTVDQAYHVATDANGVPLDATGDGLPDYVKDSNGDGVLYDAGGFGGLAQSVQHL